jgi:hypothetical protein
MHKPSESSETKLERYFGLAEKIRSLVNEFIREGSKKQKSEP